ncbi:MAG: hypothetical protein Q8K17_00005, partial [Pseudohongiella sp.]|nr:hypothetical protein [Pseudohongiella sp.]
MNARINSQHDFSGVGALWWREGTERSFFDLSVPISIKSWKSIQTSARCYTPFGTSITIMTNKRCSMSKKSAKPPVSPQRVENKQNLVWTPAMALRAKTISK